MGISQSLDVLFGSPSLQTDSEQANVYQYLQRVEKTLWVATPWWEQGPLNDNGVGGGDSEVHTPSKRRDPFKKLTPGEALALIPGLLDDAWVSPLVALTDCVDPIARSTGIALLSRIVHKDSVAKIFLAVDGMTKMVALLDSQDEHNIHLALECIFTLCAGRPNVVLPFCEAGLIGRLTTLAKGDNVELVLASLKVLRLTLHQSAVKAEVSHRKFVPVLMELVHSAHAMIAKTAVICIGLSLPNAENLAEISRLGCIDAFLRLMTPANPSVDAVIFALSLVADETDTIFPREQTTTTLTRMLETLRGGAKRSASASATSYLFASLAKSSIFHAAICTEPNLGILAKLLVGGSSGVLTATAYALGIVAINANDRVRHMLFEVGAPQNLLQLVKLSVASSSPGRDEKVARLAIFALANVMNEALVSHAGALSTEFLSYVHDRAITNLGTGSTYSLKLLAALNTVQRVKELLCKAASVARLLEYLRVRLRTRQAL
ncbi:hypothetical protein PHYBOEH_011653 [Phytophthora boehmeriae]|uniref:Uncharacterized protein n=1 Tax=Phytophthora boehmeriae TaxID=109152 RepID=A0A8T1XDC0_9STRA|nr:hypothetical protein PHYBOEH_011653 [Phytophthora boehmeriae]